MCVKACMNRVKNCVFLVRKWSYTTFNIVNIRKMWEKKGKIRRNRSMTKKRSSEIFTLKMEIFPEIGPRKFFLVPPQIRRQVSAHGGINGTADGAFAGPLETGRFGAPPYSLQSGGKVPEIQMAFVEEPQRCAGICMTSPLDRELRLLSDFPALRLTAVLLYTKRLQFPRRPLQRRGCL